MARHPQARGAAELKGDVRHNPQRYQNDPPKSELPIGEPPDGMSPAAKKVWAEIVSLSIKGVLQGPHRLLLEIASNLMSEYRVSPADFTAAKLTHLRGALAQLCLTPGEQQKLGLNKKPDDDPFAAFFTDRKTQ